MLLFAGFMSHLNSIVAWLRWLQYLSPARYTLEIFFRSEYIKGDFNPNDELNSYPVGAYGYNIGTAWCFIIMTLISLAVRVLGYFFLKMQTINT